MPDSMNSSTVDDEIYQCLNLKQPKSFFLFAGAGSGKTRSLVEVLKKFRKNIVQAMQLNGQRIAIITYTNAAYDEIKRRLEFDPAFNISTIHSFAWELINPYHDDIKEWLKGNLLKEIASLDEKLEKARDLNGKTALENKAKRDSKKNRLDNLNHVSKFSYSPNGINSGKDSLNHSEVINIASNFLLNQQLMRRILARKFPVLLIDESQDTKKELIEAFFSTQAEQKDQFCLGLFGDTMQRIYVDGKVDLGISIPDSWAKPFLPINYRCPSRVIELINKIRLEVYNQQQVTAKTDEGYVRLFIINASDDLNKFALEIKISKKMADITADSSWTVANEVKTLTLEHHMAANRGGFAELFIPLYSIKKLSTGVLDGTLRGMTFFTKQILPLVFATQANDEFTIAQVVRKHSPMLSQDQLQLCESQLEQIRKAEIAVNSIKALWQENNNPTLLSILQEVSNTGLFPIPDVFSSLVDIDTNEADNSLNEINSAQDDTLNAWKESLSAPLSQLESYFDYISENSSFGTHQGIKGLEFPRVMVILDDEESKGFLFSYEKLFGTKILTKTDIKNKSEGKESGIDRTRRLFYVTCSRAEKSLAIVAYTKAPEAVKNYALSQGWFREEEIIDSF
jgi:DNA helicase-2/ATP-dependent DNA helicase PcrA